DGERRGCCLLRPEPQAVAGPLRQVPKFAAELTEGLVGAIQHGRGDEAVLEGNRNTNVDLRVNLQLIVVSPPAVEALVLLERPGAGEDDQVVETDPALVAHGFVRLGPEGDAGGHVDI